MKMKPIGGTMVAPERDHVGIEEREDLAQEQTSLKGKEVKQIHLRLPAELHALLERSAAENRRSLNAEALVILEQHLVDKYGR